MSLVVFCPCPASPGPGAAVRQTLFRFLLPAFERDGEDDALGHSWAGGI